MGFPPFIAMSPGDEYKTYRDERFRIGTQGRTPDGNVYRFAMNGAALLVAGDLLQGPALVANHSLQTPVAAAIGDTAPATALGASTSIDQYKDGLLSIELGTGFGYGYRVASHGVIATAGLVPIQDSGGRGYNYTPAGVALNVALGAAAAALNTAAFGQSPATSAVQVAIPATANSVSLVSNPWKNVIQQPTATTGMIVGVAVKPLTANAQAPAVPSAAASFGWVQTHGLAQVTTEGTLVVGQLASRSVTTAGAAAPQSATIATMITQPHVGYVTHVATTTNKSVIFLTID